MFMAAMSGTALLISGLAAGAREAVVQADLTAAPRAVSPMLWGLFYEDINHAADGGLYAEQVKNRVFEDGSLAPGCRIEGDELVSPTGWKMPLRDCADPLTGWAVVAEGGAEAELALDDATPFDIASPHNGRLTVTKASPGRAGLANTGYWGIRARKDAAYTLSFHARAQGFAGTLTATIESADGARTYASAPFEPRSGDWTRFEARMICSDTDPRARLVLAADQPGVLWLDGVSLFPEDTWKGRPNGLRPEIAEMLAALKPAFLRFPGGCIVEGFTPETAWNWKETLGDTARRPGRHNLWGYRSSEGFGYHELLQFAEDIGAEPILVLNAGMTCQGRKPIIATPDQLQPWIDSALEAIEYANGPVESTWGAVRAANGHPEPFHLRFFTIGNENSGPDYEAHYHRFAQAIRERHPGIELIANAPVPGGTVDYIEEHFYATPEWFMNNSARYDERDRSEPPVFVSEYAANTNAGKGNLAAAVGEAAFMVGMERNGDFVKMAAYAPLLQHAEDRTWPVNLINFNNETVYGTPSYYAQKLFAENRPSKVFPTTVITDEPEKSGAGGKIGVGVWHTTAEFKDIEVVSPEGEMLWKWAGDDLKEWTPFAGGRWEAREGSLVQSDPDCYGFTLAGAPEWTDYTLRMKALKTGGDEGFLICFRATDWTNWRYWNIGGWGNVAHGVERCIDGARDETTGRVPAKVEAGHWYDIEVSLRGRHVQCRLDGEVVHEFDESPIRVRTFEAGVGVDEATGDYIVKLVNFGDAPRAVRVKLDGAGNTELSGKAIVLTSASAQDENSLEAPTTVIPKETPCGPFRAEFVWESAPCSLTILRLK